MRKCSSCKSAISRAMEACPICRQRQPRSHQLKYWVGLVAVILAWLAFH